MKNKADSESDAESVEMRAEYDFSGGVRGKYAERYGSSEPVEIRGRRGHPVWSALSPGTEDPT